MGFILVQYMVTNNGVRKPDFYYGGRNEKYHDLINLTARDCAKVFETEEKAGIAAGSLNKGGYSFEAIPAEGWRRQERWGWHEYLFSGKGSPYLTLKMPDTNGHVRESGQYEAALQDDAHGITHREFFKVGSLAEAKETAIGRMAGYAESVAKAYGDIAAKLSGNI